jgi:hypothetical protein
MSPSPSTIIRRWCRNCRSLESHTITADSIFIMHLCQGIRHRDANRVQTAHANLRRLFRMMGYAERMYATALAKDGTFMRWNRIATRLYTQALPALLAAHENVTAEHSYELGYDDGHAEGVAE